MTFAGVRAQVWPSEPAVRFKPVDIIERTGRDVTADGQVPVSVLTSKDGDCPVDSASALDVSALRDMHNEFCEQISAGMEKLASDQGKGGLPAGPAAGPKQVAEGQASPSADAKDLLARQVQEADRTETEVNDELRRSVQPPLPIGPIDMAPQNHGNCLDLRMLRPFLKALLWPPGRQRAPEVM